MSRRFHQVDVFGSRPRTGNPLAVIHEAQGLDEATLAELARWTNLSETTFLLPATDPAADYRVRIFTPTGELPFAGHPTLGSAAAWMQAGGRPRTPGVVVQQCEIGRVRVRFGATASTSPDPRPTTPWVRRLAFEAPPLRRTGPLDEALVERIAAGLGIERAAIFAHQWVDNGPHWCAVMLRSAQAVRDLQPDLQRLQGLELGVVGPEAPGLATQFEVRAFVPGLGVTEDPVTGSLNAGLAQWLIGSGMAPAAYVAAQGSALQREGRIHVQREGDAVWIGGDVAGVIEGTIDL